MPGPENSFTLVLIETEISGATGRRSRVALVLRAKPFSLAIFFDSSNPDGKTTIPAGLLASVSDRLLDETRISFPS